MVENSMGLEDATKRAGLKCQSGQHRWGKPVACTIEVNDADGNVKIDTGTGKPTRMAGQRLTCQICDHETGRIET